MSLQSNGKNARLSFFVLFVSLVVNKFVSFAPLREILLKQKQEGA